MKKPSHIIFWIYHILMKFLPFILAHETELSVSKHESNYLLMHQIALFILCYAAGSCLWDYFIIKKLKAGEKVNLLLPAAIDTLLFAVAAVFLTKHLLYLQEVCGYEDFFEFVKAYFTEYRPR